MSRGGLLLRCVRSGEELAYVPVEGAVRHGPRPPKLHADQRDHEDRGSGDVRRSGHRASIPRAGSAKLRVEGKDVQLTNLDKPFWPELGITKGDLIQYYADVAPLLLPHIRDRAMVMKRYPHGAAGEFFFMKRAPVAAARLDPHLPHRSRLGKGVIDFPDHRRPAVAALGDQSRVHRSQPVVRDV